MSVGIVRGLRQNDKVALRRLCYRIKKYDIAEEFLQSATYKLKNLVNLDEKL